MNKEGGGSQAGACAVCRHQRRRSCRANCQFREFFPAERLDDYEMAYRLFGLSNIKKIMESVEPEQRRDCAESILQEASIWRNNPEGQGCLGYVNNLISQIHSKEWEMAAVNQQLALFRATPSQRQSGLDSQNVSTEEMPPQRMDEEHHQSESTVQRFQQGESSGVSKVDDKGKKIAEE